MPDSSGQQMVEHIHDSPYVTANIDRHFDAGSLLWDGEALLDQPFTANRLLEAVSPLPTRRIHTATAS